MSFGYRMGVTLFRQGIVGFVSLVVPLVTRYIMESSVRRWIIQSGGWVGKLYICSGWPNKQKFRSITKGLRSKQEGNTSVGLFSFTHPFFLFSTNHKRSFVRTNK